MSEKDLSLIIEALLISAEQPLSIDRLLDAFPEDERPDRPLIREALQQLHQDYSSRAFELIELATGFCLQTKVHYAQWIGRLDHEKPQKYSNAVLETLAVIAYRQPVTRAEIEEIRGVSTNSTIIKTLLERDWIKIAGRRDVPGKPAVLVTTNTFLDYFNLKSLHDLPPVDIFQAENRELIT